MTTENRKPQQDSAMDGSTFPQAFDGSSSSDDAWIESLLREDAAKTPHIADDGFAFRVMLNMPPPRKPAPRWIVPGAAMLGSAAAVGLTPAGVFFAKNLVDLLDFRHFSIAHLVVIVPIVVLYACSFSALRER